MRSGMKEHYNRSIFIYFILVLIVILSCGILVYNILVPSKPNIILTINKENNFVKFSTSNDVKANLYQAAPQIQNTATRFLNAKAMVIGDSTAEGLSAYQALDSSSVIWKRGRSIQYMYDDMGPVIEYNPKVLFLAYGANDLLSWNGNVDGYINAYSKVLDYLSTTLPNTKICVNSILPVSEDAAAKNPAFNYEKEFNLKLKALCDSRNITYIDNRDLLNSISGKKYENDGVHPKPAYYKLWASNMVNKSGI